MKLTRLVAFCAILTLTAQSGQAGEIHSDSVITIQEGSAAHNAYREHSIKGVCDGRLIEVKLIKQADPRLTRITATSNGDAASESSIMPIQALIGRSSGEALVTLKCLGPDRIEIGLIGSLLDPVDGEDDDFIRIFALDFD